MGLNVNLCSMLGVPRKVKCPRCGRTVPTHFEDYDIECGNPNRKPGFWSLGVFCFECEHDWRIEFLITSKVIEPGNTKTE